MGRHLHQLLFCLRAASLIPQGSLLGPIRNIELLLKRCDDEDIVVGDVVQVNSGHDGQIRPAANGQLGAERTAEGLLAARHICEQNMVATAIDDQAVASAVDEPTAHTTLVVRALRDIQPGEQLRAWYDAATSMRLALQPLLPVNLTAQLFYTCQRCTAQFNYPNPLKCHWLLGCEGVPERRGHAEVTDESERAENEYAERNYRRQLLLVHLRQALGESLEENERWRRATSAGTASWLAEGLREGEQLARAMLAAQDTERGGRRATPDEVEPLDMIPKSLYRVPPLHADKAAHDGVASPSSADFSEAPEAPNGRSRSCSDSSADLAGSGGFLCIYCGKRYSRKYGLKIHLRTHTGYKPLKCKFCRRAFGDPSNLNKHLRLHYSRDHQTP